MKFYAVENNQTDARCRIEPYGIFQTLKARMGTGGNNCPFVLVVNDDEDMFVANSSGNGITAPIDASYYKGQGLRQGIEREYVVMKAYCAGNGQLVQAKIQNVVNCLDCMHDQKMMIIENEHYYTKQGHGDYIDGKVASSLKSRDYKEYTDIVQEDMPEKKYVLRRLTPMECARLQGFPDWWCDEANGSDSAQYKLWGNGLALPCACDVLGRIAEELRSNA